MIWNPTPEQIEGMKKADEERRAMAMKIHERHEEKKREKLIKNQRRK